MVETGFSSSANCTTSSTSSKPQGNGSPPPETNDEPDHVAAFMAFAGTEGYDPVAYIPYIVADIRSPPETSAVKSSMSGNSSPSGTAP